MKIAGFKKQSLIDYPGNITAVVFTQGCNFRCVYCHNPDLVLPEKFSPLIDEQEVLEYIRKYKKLLDAVCISGGEPTLHQDLHSFISKIKSLDLKVKLDTNGSHPDILKSLLKNDLLDFVAMDIKQLLNYEAYKKVCGHTFKREMFCNILESVRIITELAKEYQFRTTILKNIHKKEHIQELKNQFGKHYNIQNFRNENILNPDDKLIAFEQEEFEELV